MLTFEEGKKMNVKILKSDYVVLAKGNAPICDAATQLPSGQEGKAFSGGTSQLLGPEQGAVTTHPACSRKQDRPVSTA